MKDELTMLSKGARLLVALGFPFEVEQEITRLISERWLLHFHDVSDELVSERLPSCIVEPYCHYVLLKGTEDPKNGCEFDKVAMGDHFRVQASALERIMASPNIPYRHKLIVNKLLTRLHIPLFVFDEPTIKLVK